VPILRAASHQPEGYGAEREDRFVYGEGLCDVDTALDLLARLSLISAPRISSLAIGGVFKRIFLPRPPIQKCGNFSRRCAVVLLAPIGDAHTETPSVLAMS
jgi:hypothetical protein